MVEWKKLGEVCTTVSPPKKLEKELYAKEGLYPIIDQGQKDIVGFTDDKSAVIQYGEYILFGDHTRYVKYHKGVFAQGADGLKILRGTDGVIPRYLFFAFSNTEIPSRGYSRHWSIAKELLIPIPSLAEQERIVGILDTFTASIENLKEQIAQRRKQYEYYRDQLLDLEGKEGVEMKTLPEISINQDRIRKPITSSKRKAGIYPYYGASGIVDYVDDYLFDGDYLLISEDGANLIARSTPIAFSIGGKNWVNNHAHVLQFKDKFTQKYVEIYFNMIDLEPWINGAAQPKLNQDNLNKISIPIPSLSEQERIVSILDTFEASIANLEAQLKEREKQYEYYRNKLLTFE